MVGSWYETMTRRVTKLYKARVVGREFEDLLTDIIKEVARLKGENIQ